MDENFIEELVADGEKRFAFEIPLAMSIGDALNSLNGTLGEVISASGGWTEKDGLKTNIALEAEGWRGIFAKTLEVAGADAMVNTLDGNPNMITGLVNSGNKVMKHFYMHSELGTDVLKMAFVFRASPGIKIEASVDFG